jgi:3-oxoadipate enol-lactonase
MRLHVERHGEGEPLLFITGFTISSAVFEPVLDRYARRFACILYDNRGSGRSPAPLWPTSMPELAADAASVLERAGVPAAHVYGVSMGGMIAQELAIRFPERVRGLVLGGTTPGGPRAVRPTLAELRALGSALRQDRAAHLFSPAFRREHPDEVRRLLGLFVRHRPPPQGVVSHLLATIYHDTVSRLGQIQAPTFVLHGDEDAMSPLANARLLAERIPDAELAIVPGAGHAYALEQPERSYALLADWMDRRSPIAPGVARAGVAAAAEPLTRAFGLPIGAARTGASLAGLVGERLRTRRGHVAADR